MAADPYAEFSAAPDPYAEFKPVPSAAPAKDGDFYDPEGDAARAGVGGSQLVASTVANIPHAAAHAAVDLYNRIFHGSADTPNAADTLPAWAGGPVPLGEEGKQTAAGLATMASPVTQPVRSVLNSVDTAIGNVSPTAQDILHQAGGVASDVLNLAPVAPLAGIAKSGIGAAVEAAASRAPTITEIAQEAANRTAASTSAGAAGTAVDVSKLSPETQAELATVKNVNPTALKNIHDAETLPVPMTGERAPTAGQATENAELISNEFNRKGENNNAMGRRYDAQDEGLQENLQEIHRSSAPTAVGNDDIQNGRAVRESLQRYDQPKVAEINAAYKDANDANIAAGKGGLTLDPKAAVDHATTALEDRMELLPSEGKAILTKLQAAADSGQSIPLKQAETWRTTIASASRQYEAASNGNAVKALSDLRDAVEKMTPDNAATSDVANKFTTARGLAKARFAEMDADPAYKAAAEDETPIGRASPIDDDFTRKYVLNGTKADLQQLRPKLDQEGGDAMTSVGMNYLKKQAGLEKDKFIQNGYNTALTKIAPRAAELIGNSDAIDQLQKLGRVSKRMQVTSRGSYPNTSHSFVAAAKALGSHAIEDLANGVAPGARLGTKGMEFLARRAGSASLHESLKPGAGLEL